MSPKNIFYAPKSFYNQKFSLLIWKPTFEEFEHKNFITTTTYKGMRLKSFHLFEGLNFQVLKYFDGGLQQLKPVSCICFATIIASCLLAGQWWFLTKKNSSFLGWDLFHLWRLDAQSSKADHKVRANIEVVHTFELLYFYDMAASSKSWFVADFVIPFKTIVL